MRRPTRLPRLALTLALATLPAAVTAGEVTLDGRAFTLPSGFTIERVAGTPLVDRPIVADFDEKGRLYVADSSGTNDKVEKQLIDRPHRIVRLVDTDGDGKFDTSTVFADKMMFPSGSMWFEGSLYVSAPPSIWKLTDTDDDGVADRREEWFNGKTLTGCANDLHGPYRGPDGWIYWTKGAFATQTYERPGKSPFVTKVAHIFRARPDGSGIEPVMTGGMDNPVDVVFSPGGERFFTTTFLQNPADGKRDGLIHAIYGGVYGKLKEQINEHPRTSPEVMPVLVHMGAAAPSGLAELDTNEFGPDSAGQLLATNFSLRRITRTTLKPSGATFAATTDELLKSTDPDFHPTDVLEDADGSVLVVDTGGWYKLCCPSSQLPSADVLGAIYRVRFNSAGRPEDPRGQSISFDTLSTESLTRLLEDKRPFVRRRATEILARRGAESAPFLAKMIDPNTPTIGRIAAVWTASRIDSPGARAVARKAIEDADPTVRQAAIHAVALWRDKGAVPALLNVLVEPPSAAARKIDPQALDRVLHNRRVAGEALGRVGDKSAVPALLKAVGDPSYDRTLEHSLTFALIEIADPAGTALGLTSENPRTRRAALVAIDQMEGGKLETGQVAALLTSTEPTLRETASWIAGRHPDWADALAGSLRERLKGDRKSPAEQAELVDQLAKFSRSSPVQALLASTVADPKAPAPRRLDALRAMAKSRLKETPQAWVDALASLLKGADADLIGEAVATVRTFPELKGNVADLAASLAKVGADSALPDATRMGALAVTPGGLPSVNPTLFAYLRDRLDPDESIASRTAAAAVIARSKLTDEQLGSLVEVVHTAGPLEVDRLLTAYEGHTDEALGLRLLDGLKGAASLGSLRVEMLKPRLDPFGPKVGAGAEALYAAINVDAAAQKAKLEAILPTLAGGDVRRGQTVFNGAKAACITCHAVGYQGGKVGPDFSNIGELRTERDLLESILYPSLSFVRSYEPMTIATKGGKVINGLLKADSSDEVVLAINATDLERVPRADIEEMRPGTVSVMPAGLDQQLTRQELADLIAFLKSRK